MNTATTPPVTCIHSVGHSTRALTDFIALLQAYRLEQLADVRTIPRSRRNPQFNQDTLPAALHQHAISPIPRHQRQPT